MGDTNAPEETNDEQRIEVRMEWGDLATPTLDTVYANQLVITHAGGEFYLVFGEIVPPLIRSAEDAPAELIARPVARIAISMEAMPRFAKAIQDNVEKFKRKQAEHDED